ncbi:hypothetical protein BDR03DRAFT_940895 [Suillus americanus]|nr:hypothetical protein BDR03DRAFT_940895 [Suillus americanus]
MENSQEQGTNKQDGEGNQGAGEGIQGAGRDSQVIGEDAKFASGDTHEAGGNTEDADPSLKAEPTPLTPEQSEAETNRIAFLLKQVTGLEASRTKLKSSDVQGLSEIQALLDLIQGRITRTNFAGAFTFPNLTLFLPALMLTPTKTCRMVRHPLPKSPPRPGNLLVSLKSWQI